MWLVRGVVCVHACVRARVRPEYYVGNFVVDQPRLPVGSLQVTWTLQNSNNKNHENGGNATPRRDTTTNITAPAPPTTMLPMQFSGRVALHNAHATLNATALDDEDDGSLAVAVAAGFTLDVWASADFQHADVVVVETQARGGLDLQVSFVPAKADSTWAARTKAYVYNPPPVTTSTSVAGGGGVLNITTQPHLAVKGTAHATAVMEVLDSTASSSAHDDNDAHEGVVNRTFVVSVSPVLASAKAAVQAATAEVDAATFASPSALDALRSKHAAWWSDFWPAGGFLSVDHAPLEAFWWIQVRARVRARSPTSPL